MIVGGLTNGSPTVDDIAIRFQSKPNEYMYFGELLTALRSYGLDAGYKRPLFISDIMTAIEAGRPMIALVKYPLMPRQFAVFTGYHFIVLYGYVGDSIIYHDPLSAGYEYLLISAKELDKAMSDYSLAENLPYQGIVAG